MSEPSRRHFLVGTLIGLAALAIAILAWLYPFEPGPSPFRKSEKAPSTVSPEPSKPEPPRGEEPPRPSVRQPIVLPNRDYGIEGGRSAEASVTLEPGGVLTGSYTIINRVAFQGYHGAIVITLTAPDGTPLKEFTTSPLGVDGDAIPGGTSRRTENFRFEVPPEMLDQIKDANQIIVRGVRR